MSGNGELLTQEAAEDEPEVRLLRLETTMGHLIGQIMNLNAATGAASRKFKDHDIAINGTNDAIRQMVKVKRF